MRFESPLNIGCKNGTKRTRRKGSFERGGGYFLCECEILCENCPNQMIAETYLLFYRKPHFSKLVTANPEMVHHTGKTSLEFRLPCGKRVSRHGLGGRLGFVNALPFFFFLGVLDIGRYLRCIGINSSRTASVFFLVLHKHFKLFF